MGRTLNVLNYGLGPIGQAIARLVMETPGLKIVGAIDFAPDLAGHDLGRALGLDRRLRVKVEADAKRALRDTSAEVAILCTGSSLKQVRDQIEGLVRRGINVVTTCEELAFPTPRNRAAFRELDALARGKKVSVLGTGINPGFVMDALALMLTAPCTQVERLSVTRIVDVTSRRLPLQRKVGAGLNLNQFRRAVTEKSVGHVGLPQSLHFLAAGLGWTLSKVEESIEPAIAPRDLETEFLRVPAGAAAGVRQMVTGYRDGSLALSLELQMYVGAEPVRDQIIIDGTPPLEITVSGGIPGDQGTAAIVVNSIPKLMGARPGLVTVHDIPPVHRFNVHELKELPLRKK